MEITRYLLFFFITCGLFHCASNRKLTQTEKSSQLDDKKSLSSKPSSLDRNSDETLNQTNNGFKNSTIDEAMINQWIEEKKWEQLRQFCYRQLEEISIKDDRCWSWLGLIAFHEGKLKLARYYYKRALENQGNAYHIYVNIGLVDIYENRFSDALKAFRKAIELKSSNSALSVAEINMINVFLKFKDYRKSQIVLETIDENKIKDPGLLNNFAVVYMLNDKLDLAEKMFKKGLSINGNNKMMLLNYCIYQVEYRKNYDQGRKLLDRLIFLGVPAEMQEVVSKLELKLNELKR